jgi:hypothetical protein
MKNDYVNVRNARHGSHISHAIAKSAEVLGNIKALL